MNRRLSQYLEKQRKRLFIVFYANPNYCQIVYSHTTLDRDWEQDQEWDQDQWVCIHVNVYTGPRKRKVPELIISCCTIPVPCTTPGPGPVLCEKVKTEVWRT